MKTFQRDFLVSRLILPVYLLFTALTLSGQTETNSPSIKIIIPAGSDRSTNSLVTLVRAEIYSNDNINSFRILGNGKVVADQKMTQLKAKDDKTSILESLVTLQIGTNTIIVEAQNNKGKSGSEQFSIICHPEPFVDWILPEGENSDVLSGNIIIRAAIKSELELKNVIINLNGSEIPVTDLLKRKENGIFEFEKPVILDRDKNNILISATNQKGTGKSSLRSVRISGVSPSIKIISPSPSDTINNSGIILVRAEIISKSPLQTFRIVDNDNIISDEKMTVPKQMDSITYLIESLAALKSGMNKIRLEASNSKGVSRSNEYYVNNHPQPFILWISPSADNTTINSGALTVKAEIKSELDINEVNINLNGKPISCLDGISRSDKNTYILEKTLSLDRDKNSIEINASNSRGPNKSSAKIIRISGMLPEISVINPALSDSTNNTGVTLVRAQIVSKSPLLAFRIFNNDRIASDEKMTKPVQKDSITFIIESLVALQQGNNVIYAEATNVKGSSKSDERYMISHPQPFISWLTPDNDLSITNTGSVLIKASIKTELDLNKVSINLNGTVIPVENGFSRTDNSTYLLEKNIVLDKDRNSIAIMASNAKGDTRSFPRIVRSTGEAPSVKVLTPKAADSVNNTGVILVSAEIISKTPVLSFRIMNNSDIASNEIMARPTKKDSTTYLVESLVALKSGLNSIYVEARNTNGNSGSEKHNVTCILEPIIKWIMPSSMNSTTGSNMQTVKAEIITGFDLLKTSINLNDTVLAVDNNDIKRLDNNIYSFEEKIRLVPGENNIVVKASNAKGIATSVPYFVTYKPEFISEINWINPSGNNLEVNSSELAISAVVKTNSKIKTASLFVNDTIAVTSNSSTLSPGKANEFSYRNLLKLKPGLNVIYLSASTEKGTISSEKISVNYTVPPPPPVAQSTLLPLQPEVPVAIAPALLWISPSNTTTDINLNSARIKIKVKSEEKLKSLMTYVNGKASDDLNQLSSAQMQGDILFEKAINLLPGQNEIYIVATNSNGTTKSEVRYLTNPPTNPPVITWMNPKDDKVIVNSEMVLVEACIKSATVLKSAQIFVNGNPQASELVFQQPGTGDCNYTFAKPVILRNGDNSVIVMAENYAGSANSDRRIIKYEISTVSEKRLALVFGNADYGNSNTLKNPVNDANLMEGTLKELGFDVIKRLNATKNDMEAALRDFSNKLPLYNVALFYYAGHGVAVDGENYLVPVDAVMANKTDCQWDAVPVDKIVRQFEQVPDNVNIIILDACRDNPFRSWTRGSAQGFRALNPISGTFVSFATAAGSVAADGTGLNGTFTEELAKQMVIPQSIFNVFINTRKEVMRRTNGAQRPQEWNMLTGDFFFKK